MRHDCDMETYHLPRLQQKADALQRATLAVLVTFRREISA